MSTRFIFGLLIGIVALDRRTIILCLDICYDSRTRKETNGEDQQDCQNYSHGYTSACETCGFYASLWFVNPEAPRELGLALVDEKDAAHVAAVIRKATPRLELHGHPEDLFASSGR